MCRDTFHCPRLLQAPSSLAWDTARDPGAATAALGTLGQGLPTLPASNSFPISASKPGRVFPPAAGPSHSSPLPKSGIIRNLGRVRVPVCAGGAWPGVSRDARCRRPLAGSTAPEARGRSGAGAAGEAAPGHRRNSSGRCSTLIPGIVGASGGGGSHGVHSLHRDPCSPLGLQEVCGALHLPHDCPLHQACLAQESCAGATRHQAGARRQHWGPSGTCGCQERPGGRIWKP